MVEEQQQFLTLCNKILNQDHSVRFVGLADSRGRLIVTVYRRGLKPLMDHKDTEKYTIQTVLRAAIRETFADKIGRLRYAVGTYEKLIRATIPISFGKNHKFYLLMSFDLGSDADSILEKKVLYLITENKEYFL